ncbi:glycosyl hydrolase 53 family protein [Amycolatopsis sp. NPDC026612]|uniref:glycosyl hydrolase 53 family protein n=1 Tax=Amycolatopsis sp. NPDC026612 TaxID=3155466 RepID=UPI0033E775B3
MPGYAAPRSPNARHLRSAGVLGSAILAVAGCLLPGGAAAASWGPAAAPLVDVAVTATATADTEQPGHRAALAVDGDGATTWCPTGPGGAITIDLGRPQAIEGFGLTLLGAGPGDVRLETGPKPGNLRPAATASNVAAGVPTWLSARLPTPVRYVRATVTGSAPGSPCLSAVRVLARSARGMVLGDDLSFAVQESAVHNVFRDRGVARLPEEILAAHGANYVRLRLWNDPPGGYSDLPSVLAMAKRAKTAGMRILLDFHYSDFWADPQGQATPRAWQGQDLPALATTVRNFTRDTLNALAAQHTPASMVAIGNEIRNGMLWPAGKVDWSTGAGWDALGTLLRAGAAGAADAAGPTPLIQLHFDQGGDNESSRRFFDNVVAQRVPFDVIGLSYYPFWHGTVSQLRANLDDLATRYGKQVALAETQYAWTLADGDSTGNFMWQESQLLPGYPATPGGQLAFVSDLTSILAAVPGGRGLGLFYWQPEWIPGVGWTPGEGTPNDNLTQFDFDGDALPAVSSADPLRACRLYPAQVACGR